MYVSAVLCLVCVLTVCLVVSVHICVMSGVCVSTVSLVVCVFGVFACAFAHIFAHNCVLSKPNIKCC